MAEIVRQAQAIKNIIALLIKEFDCKVYSDEVRENFQKPCFFISASSVMTPQTVNWMDKELTILLMQKILIRTKLFTWISLIGYSKYSL